MIISVLLKQIPDPVAALNVAGDAVSIDLENMIYTTNESDNYALEEALLLKEAHGGEVVVVTAGPERAVQVLKDALSKGADRAIHLIVDENSATDVFGMATLLSRVLEPESSDLVFTGLQSDDRGDGQLGPMLAELLGMPHVTLVVATAVDGSAITVKQELEGGWFQNATTDMPTLLTIQSGINKPRYASLRGIMAMKSKEIKVVHIADLGLDPADWTESVTLTKLYLPTKTKQTQFLEGSAPEIVTQLLEKLTHEAKVL